MISPTTVFTVIKDREPIVGELNVNIFVADQAGNIFLQRIPRENPTLFQNLEKEYKFIGFTDLGGKVRRRTAQEQATFSRETSSIGLHTLPPAAEEGGIMLYRFLDGAKTLDQYLPGVPTDRPNPILTQLFRDLYEAHRMDIVYGDRWSKNMLVLPGEHLTHIDFDLEISGPPAKDFEVAQVAYYAAIATPEALLPQLAKEMNIPGWYDLNHVVTFLRKHVEYFSGKTFGDKFHRVEPLISLLLDQQKKI